MTNKQQDTSPWKNTILTVNGAEHNLLLMLKTASTGPLIDVKVNELALDSDIPDNRVLYTPHNADIHDEGLVVYKHNGKFLVLSGRNIAIRARTNKEPSVSARLISTPALKRARIIKEVEKVHIPTPAPTSGYNRNSSWESRQPQNKPYNKRYN